VTHGSDEYAVNSAGFLPDGKHFLYTAYHAPNTPSRIKVGTLGKPDSSVMVTEGSTPKFSSGYLLFVRGGRFWHSRSIRIHSNFLAIRRCWGKPAYFLPLPAECWPYPREFGKFRTEVFDRSGNVVATPVRLPVTARRGFLLMANRSLWMYATRKREKVTSGSIPLRADSQRESPSVPMIIGARGPQTDVRSPMPFTMAIRSRFINARSMGANPTKPSMKMTNSWGNCAGLVAEWRLSFAGPGKK